MFKILFVRGYRNLIIYRCGEPGCVIEEKKEEDKHISDANPIRKGCT